MAYMSITRVIRFYQMHDINKLVILTGEVHQYNHNAEATYNGKGNGDVNTLFSPGTLLVRGDVLARAFRWSFLLPIG